MYKYIITIALIANSTFTITNSNCEYNQRRAIEEYAIIKNFLVLDSVGQLFRNYHKTKLPPREFREAYISAILTFYNRTDLPEWYTYALQKLLISKINALQSSEFSEEEVIEKMKQETKSFEEQLKYYCSPPIYTFYSSMHSYIAAFEESYPEFRSKNFNLQCNSYKDYIESFTLCDKYYSELLIYFYKEQHNYSTLNLLKKTSHLSKDESNKDIEKCLVVFNKALCAEKKRINSSNIEPVFYLVIAAISSSYHIPKKFLLEFRKYLLKLAENAMLYNYSEPTLLRNIEKINEEFKTLLQQNFNIL